ncbi:MAG: hypothetical protein AMXMBFR61_00930 [Fimbriimonadales bacterium]
MFFRLSRLALPSLVLIPAMMLAVSALGQSEFDGRDPVATVTVTPPSVVEDEMDVYNRMMLRPFELTWSWRPMKQDNTEPPKIKPGKVWNFDIIQRGGSEVGLADIGWDSVSSGSVWPPDPILAVGPNHVLVATNAGFRIYNKSGSQTYSSSFGTFFSGLAGFTFTSDPRVIYDHDSGRWFLLILGLNNSYYSWYLLAVSDDSDPNGTWKKYAIDSTLNGGTSTNNMSDYPGMGVSQDALYITANMFNRSTWSFQYVKLRVIPKQQLLDFASSITYSDLWSITNADGSTAFTIQPAQHWGTPQAPFLADVQGSNKVNVFGVNNPLGTPSLTKRSATVTSFSAPPSAVQQGGSVRLDTIDTRTYNSVWRNNSIYFAHTIGQSSVAACRWYQLNTSNWPTSVSVTTSGTVITSGVYQWFPSVAVNQDNTLFMGFCRASSNEYASIYYAYRLASDPPGQMTVPTVIKAGTRYYTGEGGSPVRWGDYTGTVVDPQDDRTFWHFNEYPHATSSSTWRTWVQQVTLTPPGDPTTLTVANVAGQIGATVTLSATLTRDSDGAPVSGKSISFKVASNSVGSGTTNGSGVATVNYTIPPSLGTGIKSIQADFAGDGTYAASTGSGNLNVSKANSVVEAYDASGHLGESVSLSAKLTRATDGAPLQGQSLRFKVQGSIVGSGDTGTNGIATINYTPQEGDGIGVKTLTVEFDGDTLHNASSGTATMTVLAANTSVTPNNASGTSGQPVTLTATLRRTTDNLPLVGRTVAFDVGGFSAGSAVTGVGGVATVNWVIPPALGTGPKTITASFAGDSLYNASSGTATLDVAPGGSTVSGVVTLEQYLGGPGQSATIEFREIPSGTVLHSATIVLDGAGNYSTPDVPNGTYDVAVKFVNWLRQVVPGVTVSGPTTVNFSLFNGDVDNSNGVDLVDLNAILATFGNPGGYGDLNWDAVVNLVDLNIVLANFGMTGAP